MAFQPSTEQYKQGFKVVEASVRQNLGVIEAIAAFRGEHARSDALREHLYNAANLLMNLEPREDESVRLKDAQARIMRIAFQGFTIGTMVNYNVYPDFWLRMGNKTGRIENPEMLAHVQSNLASIGDSSSPAGQAVVILGLAYDGLSRLDPETVGLATQWADEVTNQRFSREGIDADSGEVVSNAFGAGVGLSLNGAYWHREPFRTSTIVTPVWKEA